MRFRLLKWSSSRTENRTAARAKNQLLPKESNSLRSLLTDPMFVAHEANASLEQSAYSRFRAERFSRLTMCHGAGLRSFVGSPPKQLCTMTKTASCEMVELH